MIVNSKKLILQSDFLFIVSIAFFVLVGWTLFLGIDLGNLYGINDTFGLLVHYVEMVRSGPSASKFIYSATRLGGAVVGPVDMPIFMQLFAYLDFHPFLAINFGVILSQVLISFFCLKISLLAGNRSWYKEKPIIFFVSILAFNPAIGWRLVYGHLNIIWGSLWALSLIYLFFSFYKNKSSITGIILSFLVLVNSLQCINLIQPVFYSTIIILTFVIFFNSSLRSNYQSFVLIFGKIIIVITACVFFSFINIANILEVVSSLSRSPSSNLIYSYTVQNFRDYLSSLFYSYKTLPVERNFFLLHESNLGYGMLPLLLIVILTFLKKYRLLLLNIALFTFGIVLSSDIPLVSNFFLVTIPLIKSFRCPSRFFFPLFYFQSICFIWSLFQLKPSTSMRDLISSSLVVVVSISVFFIWGSVAEIFIFPITVCAAIFCFLFRKEKYFIYYVLPMFVSLNFLGFQDKLPQSFYDITKFQNEVVVMDRLDISRGMLEHTSAIAHSSFLKNLQSAAYGYSAIDGYIYPSKLFYEIYGTLDPSINSTDNSFFIDSKSLTFPYFSKAFNVTKEILLTSSGLGVITISKSNPVLSPSEIIYISDLKKIVLEVIDSDLNTKVFVRPELQSALSNVGSCGRAGVVRQNLSEAVVNVTSAKKCLLVLPTHYSSFLKASSIVGKTQFKIFPVNGLMTGLLLDKFSGEILIKAHPALPGEGIFKGMGFLVLTIFLVFMNLKRRKIFETTH